jgi:S-DNA-T family DNA segregation ATPase FtsK/SpoIIIE
MAGSEKLLGLGDFLFISAEVAKPKRIQAAYTSDKEVKKVVEYIRAKSNPPAGGQSSKIEDEILTEGSETRPFIGNSNFQDFEEDPLYEEAKKLVIEARKASASLLQRRLRIGYARAARLIDTFEEKGVVGPADGAKPREILLKNQEENPAEREPARGGDEQDDWKKV